MQLQHSLVSDDGPALGSQMQILLTIHFPLAFSSCFAAVFVSPHCIATNANCVFAYSFALCYYCLSFCLICLAYQRVLLIADNSRFLFACTVIIIGFRVVVVFVRVCWWL